MSFLIAAAATAQVKIRDYQLEAVYLFNFTQFIDWPPGATDDTRPFAICILGEDPFGRYLDDTVRGETRSNRPLSVARYRRVDDVADCQVLFISRSESSQLDAIVQRLHGQSVLTVSDSDDFVQRGGAIGFVPQDGRIRLHINLRAAKAAGLTISSKLLRVAESVGAEKE
jgi:hypothetical protein